MKNNSILQLNRFFLYLILGLTAVITILNMCGAFYTLAYKNADADPFLRQSAETIAQIIKQNPKSNYTQLIELKAHSPFQLQVTSQLGTVLYASKDAPPLPLLIETGFSNLDLDAKRGRMYTLVTSPQIIIQVAAPQTETSNSIFKTIFFSLVFICLIGLGLISIRFVSRTENLRRTLDHLLALRKGARHIPDTELARLPTEVRLILREYQIEIHSRDRLLKQSQETLKNFLIKLRPIYVTPSNNLSDLSASSVPSNWSELVTWLNCMHIWTVLDELSLQPSLPTTPIQLKSKLHAFFADQNIVLNTHIEDDTIDTQSEILDFLLQQLKQYLSSENHSNVSINLLNHQSEVLLDIRYSLNTVASINFWEQEITLFSRKIVDKAADAIEALIAYRTENDTESLQILFPRQPAQSQLL